MMDMEVEELKHLRRDVELFRDGHDQDDLADALDWIVLILEKLLERGHL